MSSDADDYLQFEGAIAAALMEVLAKDGHYDFAFERRKKSHGVEWTLKGSNASLPFQALVVTEKGRETEITILSTEDSRYSETVRVRDGAKVREAIEKLRAKVRLDPL
jgi:hypothetical protein